MLQMLSMLNESTLIHLETYFNSSTAQRNRYHPSVSLKSPTTNAGTHTLPRLCWGTLGWAALSQLRDTKICLLQSSNEKKCKSHSSLLHLIIHDEQN